MRSLCEWESLSASGEVKVSPVEDNKRVYTYIRNWVQRIHQPVDPLENLFPGSRSVNWDNQPYGFIGSTESEKEVRFGYNFDRDIKCDRLRRPRSSPNVILEDTRDICTRDIQLIERKAILDETNHFGRIGVSASRGYL